MSFALVLVLLVFIVTLASQFGARLTARNALVWWLVMLLLFVTAVRPEWLAPLTQLLGVKLVSNLVLAGLVLFLLLQAMQESANTTGQRRQLRELAAKAAAKDFLSRRPERSAARTLVILPCYNEERALADVIRDIRELPEAKGWDICFVNDGSTDRSEEVLRSACPNEHVSLPINIGVSGTLCAGFEIAKAGGYEYVVQCDSDGQHPVESIPALLGAARKGKIDLLIGSRFADKGAAALSHQSTTTPRRLGGLCVATALRMFRSVPWVHDPTSGFRVYSARACRFLLNCMPDDYPEPESIALLALAGAKIGEIPIEMRPRMAGLSSLAGLGSAGFMCEVITALLGLRLRSLFGRGAPQLEVSANLESRKAISAKSAVPAKNTTISGRPA